MIFLMRNGHLRGESGLRWGANHCNMERFQSVIRNGGYRCSEKIVLKSKRMWRD